MKNLRILLTLFLISLLAIIITGIVLNYLGIEHGPLLLRIGFIFIVVNVILYLLLLIFFVAKNILHLFLEKKRKAVGSKFRTRLVVSFVGLTLVPSILLFILSHQLIKNSIDIWFSLEIQEPIYDSMDVARYFYASERADAESLARLIASNPEYLRKLPLKTPNQTFRVTLIKEDDGTEIVKKALNGRTASEIIPTENGDIIRAASPLINGGGVVVVEKSIPVDVVSRMEAVRKSYNAYNQVRVQQKPIRVIYFLMLSIATLIIIFLALWISLRIAKGITVPIRTLVEATNEVAQGRLDVRIDYKRDDEIGLLIDSFNRMVNDLSEGKKSLEKAYKESDRSRLSMEAILESINSGVIFFDRMGKIVTTNNAACSMLNIEREMLIGKGHKELIEMLKSQELTSMVRRLAEKGKGSVEKEIHIYINGRPMDLRVYMTTLNDSMNNFIGTLVVFDNLTEVIAAQRALAWQEVAKRIAHEIKNPLTPIKLSAERLLKKWNENTGDFDATLRRSISTIVKETNSLKHLVDEFSRFGKMPRINLQPADLKEVIKEVVDLYNDLKDIRIVTSIQDIPEVEIDKEQIKRALINLIDNAIQAKTETIWINSYYNPELDIIRIEVKDDGIGINNEDKEKLFFPYFSTKKDGTGLGLAIVNSIISKHRGYIRVQDNKPRGTQFIIELPVGQK